MGFFSSSSCLWCGGGTNIKSGTMYSCWAHKDDAMALHEAFVTSTWQARGPEAQSLASWMSFEYWGRRLVETVEEVAP